MVIRLRPAPGRGSPHYAVARGVVEGPERGFGRVQTYLRGDGYFDPRAEIRRHQQILEERMRTLVGENPQLYEAIREFNLTKTEFEAERKKRLEGRFFVW